jgi:glycosyltransferase involved in cell wall biosynthesis
VRSILDQSLTNFELIIVDDCSTDNTRTILQEISSQDDRIKLTCTLTNSGCNIARNVGVDLAQGQYIAIMDDDDIAVHNRLEIQVEYLEKHMEIGLVGSTVQPISKRGKIASPYPDSSVINDFPETPSKVFEDVYLGKYVIPNPTLMFRGIVLKRCKYPAVKYNGADVTLILQLAALGVRMSIIPKPLVMMRQGTEHAQMTSKISRVHLGRRRRVRDIIKH